MPTTPRGYITYPSEGDTSWYTTSENGLEAWLLRAELLGIPTYDTFSDLPSAGTTEVVNPGTGKTQRQFAAVVGDATIYRDNGTSWVAWANYYTDADAVNALETASSVTTSGGKWTHQNELRVEGTSSTEDSGDAVMEVRPLSGTTLDGHYKWLAPDGGDRATLMYDGDSEQIRLWDYVGGQNLLVASLTSSGHAVEFPQGLTIGQNEVPYSSSGTRYDIQKNGTDGAGNINMDAANGQLTADGDVVAQDDPQNLELMGQTSDTDNTTDLDLTVSDSTGYDEVQFSIEIEGNASSTTYGAFIQLNGDTGANYDYNSLANGSVTQTTGGARFTFNVWGSNVEKNRFAVDGGSAQNFIKQLTGSADNRDTILSGDQTSTAADGPVTDVRVYTNFNAAGSLYAVGIPGP